VSNRRKTGPVEAADQTSGAWVTSDLTPDGQYVLTVSYNGDTTVCLDRAGAGRYAATVIAACQRACYDAAVIAQMTRRLGLDIKAAADLIALPWTMPPPHRSAWNRGCPSTAAGRSWPCS
jgi:hypothetical protein